MTKISRQKKLLLKEKNNADSTYQDFPEKNENQPKKDTE